MAASGKPPRMVAPDVIASLRKDPRQLHGLRTRPSAGVASLQAAASSSRWAERHCREPASAVPSCQPGRSEGFRLLSASRFNHSGERVPFASSPTRRSAANALPRSAITACGGRRSAPGKSPHSPVIRSMRGRSRLGNASTLPCSAQPCCGCTRCSCVLALMPALQG